jgi:cytochrome oxidase assembly protein ShyY1
MDYRRVSITGTFDHDNEVLLTPRTLLREAFDGNAGE